MFSERLENLIKAALQDGVLTDQEKAAIIKRAQEEGEDINEVDIYIQSLLQKRQQELNEDAQKTANAELMAQRKAREARDAAIAEEEKERAKILRKCPACGERIPFGTLACPFCGHVIETDHTNQEILDLMKVIQSAAPHKCSYIHCALKFTEDFSAETFDNDPFLKRAYTIQELWERDNGEKLYYVNSNYYKLISEAKTKYRGVPQIMNFLEEERKKCYELIADQLKYNLRELKDDYEKHGLRYKSQHYKYALEGIELIENKYSDIAGQEFLNNTKYKIEEGIAEEVRQKRATHIKNAFKISEILTNTWSYVIIEAIVVAILFIYFDSAYYENKLIEFQERSGHLRGSLENYAPGRTIFLGMIVIGITVYISYKKKK